MCDRDHSSRRVYSRRGRSHEFVNGGLRFEPFRCSATLAYLRPYLRPMSMKRVYFLSLSAPS